MASAASFSMFNRTSFATSSSFMAWMVALFSRSFKAICFRPAADFLRFPFLRVSSFSIFSSSPLSNTPSPLVSYFWKSAAICSGEGIFSEMAVMAVLISSLSRLPSPSTSKRAKARSTVQGASSIALRVLSMSLVASALTSLTLMDSSMHSLVMRDERCASSSSFFASSSSFLASALFSSFSLAAAAAILAASANSLSLCSFAEASLTFLAVSSARSFASLASFRRRASSAFLSARIWEASAFAFSAAAFSSAALVAAAFSATFFSISSFIFFALATALLSSPSSSVSTFTSSTFTFVVSGVGSGVDFMTGDGAGAGAGAAAGVATFVDAVGVASVDRQIPMLWVKKASSQFLVGVWLERLRKSGKEGAKWNDL
mmetsp:Transcript_25795/g.48550  ORF Transcript_25795/g.48550 Transcript_25795/m.48550 type:complete len:374 (-) Transcript_25795:4561-5682(-)